MRNRTSPLVIGAWILGGTAAFVLLLVLSIAIPLAMLGDDDFGAGNVAVIDVSGSITSASGGGVLFGSIGASSEEIVGYIEEAEEDDNIKAILIRINSPGGTAVASEEIARAVKEAKKPTVALVRDSGTSGAYWVASAADHIVASPVSITGSIGVLGSYLEFSGLMDKYGVEYEQLTAGEYKDIGTPFRNLTTDERAILQDMLNGIHEDFMQSVAENRQMSVEELRPLANGRIYTGRQALAVGLVDELGGQNEAEAYLKEQAGIKDVHLVEYKKPQGLFSGLTLETSFGDGLVVST